MNAGNAAFNSAYYQLVSDIDLSAYAPGTTLGGLTGWTPIGKSGHPFKGTFDGNGFIIRGLKIDNSSANN